MGSLVDGIWQTGDFPTTTEGAYARPASTFRDKGLALDPDRYHLYAAAACPWAHRVLITRALRGLSHAITVTLVDPRMGDDGWAFRPDDPDPLGGTHLRDVYLRADPRFTGRVTVPVLWDRKKATIVNNESRELMRLLDVDLAALAVDPAVDTLCPDHLRNDIDAVLDAIYTPINNGVYRAGFATTQEVHDAAVRELFAALAHWDAVLARQPWLCGDTLTEADVALFTTLLRFDLVYYGHFKCNLRPLRDHAHLWRFVRRLYQHPAITPTIDLDAIKTHYYWSHDRLNPRRIVPLGPTIEPLLREPV